MAETVSVVTYPGDGTTTLFSFGFDYLRKEFVRVFVDGVETPYTFHSAKTVSVVPAPAAGTVVTIRRVTSRDRIVNFVDGSVLLSSDLNISQVQVLHIAQEALDIAAGAMAITDDGAYNASFRRITQVGEPQEETDAVTKGWAETAMTSQLTQATTQRQQAQAARDAAALSASNAASSESSANSHRVAAQAARTGAEAARDAAAGSATAAQTARSGAESARNTANTARDQAVAARDTANAHRNAAAASAADAAASAADAAESALVARREIATQPEAEGGTDNTKTMTPLRVKQAIDKFAPFTGSAAGSAAFRGEPAPSAATLDGINRDFNDLVFPGKYSIAGTWANGWNGEVNYGGVVEVIRRAFSAAPSIIQIHHVGGVNSPAIYYRSGGDEPLQWGPWQKVALGDPLPVGSIIYLAGNTPPVGYLKANGAAVSRSSYADLFSVIGTTYGAGNGTSTFNLPDLRGEFIRGWDDGRGVDSGRVLGSAQADEFRAHVHGMDFGSGSGSTSRPTRGSNYNSGTSINENTKTAGGSETRPRNVALLACIKY